MKRLTGISLAAAFALSTAATASDTRNPEPAPVEAVNAEAESTEAESAAAFIEELSWMRCIPLMHSPMAPASRAKTTATTSLAMPPALSAIGPILKQPSNLDI